MFTGVPQGSVLGPLLFLVFFNDVIDAIAKAKVIKYADDTVLYFSSNSFIIIEKALSDDLTTLSTWFDNNELVANLKKAKRNAFYLVLLNDSRKTLRN